MTRARTARMSLGAAGLVCWLAGSPTAADPLQWPAEHGGTDNYYEVVEVPGGCTWEAAEQAAASSTWMGHIGYLATITSSPENEWIWENLARPVECWLGGFQLPGSDEPDQGWCWVSGETWDFTHWYPGEPNDLGGSECYLQQHALSEAGQWADRGPTAAAPGYIVEYEVALTPTEESSWTRLKTLFR